jgi:hypothetical protein
MYVYLVLICIVSDLWESGKLTHGLIGFRLKNEQQILSKFYKNLSYLSQFPLRSLLAFQCPLPDMQLHILT